MDIYKIGVRIALANGMSPVLAIIAKDLLGIHTKVSDIEKGFGRWGLAVGGVAGIMGGAAILGGLAAIAKGGEDVNHQLELMKLQGMQFSEIQQAASRAMQVSGSVLTSTYADNLAHIRELRYAFGDSQDAMKYLESVTKANATLNAMTGGGTDQVWEMVKALEQKGLTADPDQFMSYVDQMTKAVVATGGKVTPQQFMSTFKYGRTAMLGWDEAFTTQYLPRLIQSLSGGGGGAGASGSAGTSLMSAFSKIVQGQMSKKAADEFGRMGLAPGGVQPIPGSSESVLGGGVAGRTLFQSDPYAWVQKVLMPALAKHNITSQDEIIAEISQLFPVRTASSIVAEMALQGAYALGDKSPFEKDAKLQREAFDQRMSYDELIKNDYATIMTAMQAQWETTRQAIGQPLSAPGGPLVTALADLTMLLNKVAEVAQAHPQAVVIVADALAGLATAMIIGGFIALAAAIGGLIGVGGILVALAAGIAAFAALNWPLIKNVADGLEGWLAQHHTPLLDTGATWLAQHAPWLVGDDEAKQWLEKHPAASGKLGLNAIPPPSGQQTVQVSSVINMDGRKVANAVTQHQVDALSGPSQGTPYPDPTWSTAPVDLVLSR